MSNEEQQAMIGRLVMERAEANRKRALLDQELKRYPGKLNSLAADLSRTDSHERMAQAINTLDGLIAAGGLDRLKEIVGEYRTLTQQVTDLSQTLRNAGAE